MLWLLGVAAIGLDLFIRLTRPDALPDPVIITTTTTELPTSIIRSFAPEDMTTYIVINEKTPFNTRSGGLREILAKAAKADEIDTNQILAAIDDDENENGDGSSSSFPATPLNNQGRSDSDGKISEPLQQDLDSPQPQTLNERTKQLQMQPSDIEDPIDKPSPNKRNSEVINALLPEAPVLEELELEIPPN